VGGVVDKWGLRNRTWSKEPSWRRSPAPLPYFCLGRVLESKSSVAVFDGAIEAAYPSHCGGEKMSLLGTKLPIVIRSSIYYFLRCRIASSCVHEFEFDGFSFSSSLFNARDAPQSLTFIM